MLVVSALKTHCALESGGKGYLIYVVDASSDSLNIQDILVVRKFSDVFPDEIPGLPHVRELEFGIELMSGTSPISRVPYCLALLFVKKKDGSMRLCMNIDSGIRDGVLVDLTKTEAILNWSQPSTVSEIRSFLAPVLALSSGSGGFVVYTDASLQGLDCILTQNEHVIAYASRQLKTHEENYPLHDLELTGSSNPAANALIRKVYVSSLHTSAVSRVVQECCSFGFTFHQKKENQGIRVFSVLEEPALYSRIREAQDSDPKTQRLARLIQGNNTSGFHLQADGLLCLSDRVVVFDDSPLRDEIFSQANRSKFSVHPTSMKIYKDLHARFWWKGLKCGIYQFVSRCLMYQQGRVQWTRRVTPESKDFEWKWEFMTMDFVTNLSLSSRNNDAIWEIVRLHGIPLSIVSDRDPRFTSSDHRSIVMAPFEALYGCRLRTPMFGTRLRVKAAQDRHASYANTQRRPLQFQPVEHVFYEGITFPKSDEIWAEGLPFGFVILLSLLRKYVADESHVLNLAEVQLDQDLSYMERPLRIIGRKEKVLRNKRISLVMFFLRLDFEEEIS
ncbi:uncharacterized protein [Henckelia pumila]|uniref:uncharacterized protein n=1 Tax=Henckelia pumila TaxID=405737 RepID=UPI003C6E4616